MIPNPIMSTNRNLQQVVTIHSRNSWNSMICCWIWDYHSLHQTSCPKVWGIPSCKLVCQPREFAGFSGGFPSIRIGQSKFSRGWNNVFFFFWCQPCINGHFRFPYERPHKLCQGCQGRCPPKKLTSIDSVALSMGTVALWCPIEPKAVDAPRFTIDSWPVGVGDSS